MSTNLPKRVRTLALSLAGVVGLAAAVITTAEAEADPAVIAAYTIESGNFSQQVLGQLVEVYRPGDGSFAVVRVDGNELLYTEGLVSVSSQTGGNQQAYGTKTDDLPGGGRRIEITSPDGSSTVIIENPDGGSNGGSSRTVAHTDSQGNTTVVHTETDGNDGSQTDKHYKL